MSNIWFWGDIHGGHENIPKYRKNFATEDESWNTIKENHHKKVTKRDHVFFMGDTVFTYDRLVDLQSWTAAKKILILGNHCTEHLHVKQLAGVFDEIHGLVKYKEFWLSHAPIHPVELRGKYNLHGHVHYGSLDDHRYFNTCPEVNDYQPISLMEIRQEFAKRFPISEFSSGNTSYLI